VKSKLEAQSEATRERLIAATLELLPERGLHGVSLDAIAARAGVTKGAIYGHFGSKDGLIRKALGSRPESRPDQIAWPAGREGSVPARLRRLGEAVVAAVDNAGPTSQASAEFLQHALRDPKLRPWVADRGRESLRITEARIRDLFGADELAMPPRALALLLVSIIPGLTYRHALGGLDGERETVLAMFEGLAAEPPPAVVADAEG